MGNIAQKTKHFIARSLLLIAMLCLVLVVMLQIALLIGINALNTGKAHHFVQDQVTSAMEDSGYNATFDKLSYDPVRGFTLNNLTVLDKDGTIATADRISLDIAFSKIPLRQLDMVMSAGDIHLVRLPASAEENPVSDNTELQPFTVPNVYFKTFRIFRLNIDRLNIGAAVAGQDLSFSPTLQAKMKLGDSLKLDLSLLPKSFAQLGEIKLPEKLEIAGEFTPSTLAFALDNLSVLSADYNVNGKGKGQLVADGNIDINLTAAYPNLKTLTQENLESADLSFMVAGAYAHPTIRMNGTVVTASLKDKGLSDIILSASTDDLSKVLKGNVGVKTSYLKEQISLDAALSYAGDVLTVESIKGAAPLVTLDGAGELSTQNNIFDGKISVSASDLSYYKDLMSTDIAGSLKVDADFKSAKDAQAVNIAGTASQIRFAETQLGKADIKLYVADINHPWPQTANAQIFNLFLSDTMSLDEAQMVIKDAGNETYNLSVTGNGKMPSAISFNGNLNLSDINNDLPTLRDINFTTSLGKSSVSLVGELNANNVTVKLSTKNFRGSDIPATLPEALTNLRLNGDVVMSGAPANPSTTAHITANGVNTGKYKNLLITIDANHKDGKASATLSGKGAGIRTLQGHSAFPLTFALFPFVFDMDMNAPLSGDVLADLDLGSISPLFLTPTQKFSAGLKANATLQGTLSTPDVKGVLKIQNGQFIDDMNGINLHALTINSSFTRDSLVLQSLSATDGEKGRMSGSGDFGFAKDKNTNLSLSMKKFHLPASNLADGVLDANFLLKDDSVGYALRGTVDIDHMNIMVPETFQSKIPELNIVERKKSSSDDAAAKNISLAIKVNAPNQIFVRGWGLDAEFGGALDVTGDVTAPLFDGSLASKRGRYEEFGKRFTLARANLRFQGELPPSPYLDIEATTPANDVTASILLTGPVTKPSIAFSSTPALPQDEVLSRLLFGRDTAKITPFQAVQLAQTLRRFSGEGGGGFDPLAMIRSATGLDDISVDTDANGETNVGVGKYLTDKVYLEFEKGKAADSGGANIQIELTPSINVQSEIGQDAQAGGGVFWKRDY